jgi:hypothetical protein
MHTRLLKERRKGYEKYKEQIEKAQKETEA